MYRLSVYLSPAPSPVPCPQPTEPYQLFLSKFSLSGSLVLPPTHPSHSYTACTPLIDSRIYLSKNSRFSYTLITKLNVNAANQIVVSVKD